MSRPALVLALASDHLTAILGALYVQLDSAQRLERELLQNRQLLEQDHLAGPEEIAELQADLDTAQAQVRWWREPYVHLLQEERLAISEHLEELQREVTS